MPGGPTARLAQGTWAWTGATEWATGAGNGAVKTGLPPLDCFVPVLLVDQRHVMLVVTVSLYPDPAGEFVEVR